MAVIGSMEAASLGAACVAVLQCSDPNTKLMAARKVARDWRLGRLAHRFDMPPPDRPARPERPELLPPARMPRRGKGGSERARIAMVHALAHIEFVAIDLAFDLVARFGDAFPPEFADDWLRVGADEAMHFALLARRLAELGSHYGALPAHDGLWEAAEKTAHDPLARIAIVPMVLEARALDITPQTIARFAALAMSAWCIFSAESSMTRFGTSRRGQNGFCGRRNEPARIRRKPIKCWSGATFGAA